MDADQICFRSSYQSKKGLKFEFGPLEATHLDEIIKTLTKNFTERAVLNACAKVPYEDMLQVITYLCKLSMEDGLGFCCKEVESQKIVAIEINVDEFTCHQQPFDCSSLKGSFIDVHEFVNSWTTEFKPKAKYEVIDLALGFVETSYLGHALAKELIRITTDEHPLSSKALAWHACVTTPWGRPYWEGFNFEVLEEKDPLTYLNSKSEKIFAELDATAKSVGYPGCSPIYLMGKQREGTDVVIKPKVML